MPELPEVENARRRLQAAAHGREITEVRIHPDRLVFDQDTASALRRALLGRRVRGTGRKGKNFWAELDNPLWPVFHFGMSGSLHVYQEAKDRPTHWKMEWELDNGTRIAWRDPRRFGRIRLVTSPDQDPRLSRLGFDPLLALPSAAEFRSLVRKRKKNVKALLLDQSFSAGVGNWIADEILYQARIAPRRLSTSLDEGELKRLRTIMKKVIDSAVKWDADSDKFPSYWLFHYRWSSRLTVLPNGHRMIRETIAGRTTAWVPELQS